MALIIFLYVFPTLIQAQTLSTYPRTILSCVMTEGGTQLTEVRPGVFNYQGSFGALGSAAGGTAKIELMSEGEKCTLNLSAGDGARKLSRSFTWLVDKSGAQSKVSEASSQDGDCTFKQRYIKSIAQCILPSSIEPGDQCHGEGGRDLTVYLPTGMPVLKRKLVAYPGGMTIETDPGSNKGIAIWNNPKNEKSWCFELKTLFPEQCSKLEVGQKVKNLAGQIIGVLEITADHVLFKQAKQPYSETSFVLDASAPSVWMKSSATETNVGVTGENGLEVGSLKVLGNRDLPKRLSSFNRPLAEMANGNKITSDCNGVVAPASSKSPVDSSLKRMGR